MTTDKPVRIRDEYERYARGEVPFERLVAVADEILERFAARHADDPPIDEPLERLRGER